MKISKRFHLILLCMLALLTAGCGKQAEETMPRAVACTTYPIWLITHDLMQRTEDAPPLILLVPPQMGCPHDFALSTHDLLNLSMIRDLLFVANGGGLDDVILSAVQKAKPDLKTVLATGLKLDLKEHAGHKHDADHDEDADPVHDPHYFTAPGTAKILVKNIADALKKFDERNKSVYEKNESAILKKQDDLSLRAAKIAGQGKRKAVAMHGTAVHFAAETGLEIQDVLLHGHETALSPAEMRKTAELVRKESTPLQIVEPQSPAGVAELLHRETGIPVVEFDFAASGEKTVPEGYLWTVMEKNLGTLEKIRPVNSEKKHAE